MKIYKWGNKVRRFFYGGVDLIFPPSCSGCGSKGEHFCEDCRLRVPLIRKPYCEKCGLPLLKSMEVCRACVQNPPAYRAMRSWAVFDSPIKDALHTLKYRKNISLAYPLAYHLAMYILDLDWSVDCLVPVPLSQERLKERGYNQIELVADLISDILRLDFIPDGLVKIKDTRSQVGLSVSERKKNVLGVYWAKAGRVKNKSILLMDDVTTTGSTIHSAVDALYKAGARNVYAFTIARALSQHNQNVV